MNWRWIALMAWRDSRKNRSRLFLFVSSIVLGIAALVAMNSFNENLSRNIDDQAAQLIGADLELESRRKPTKEALVFIDSLQRISDGYAREERFMSMIRFPKVEGSRLVQVRSLSGAFPFYGQLQTNPRSGSEDFGQAESALIDHALMLQFDAQVKDSIQLGLNGFVIGGRVMGAPGQTSISGAMAPTVFVPLKYLEGSGLRQTGSRIDYHYYFKFSSDFNVDEFVKKMDDRFSELQLRHSTISSTKEDTGRSFADVTQFMELIGFIALLLGCIGISSAVHIYVREKLVTVAILRCLGTTPKQAFFIFLIQLAVMGFIGGILGAFLGTSVQYILPLVMQEFLPIELSTHVSWYAIAQGISLGIIIAVLFALVPLVAIRHISPLNTLRVGNESDTVKKDSLRWWIYGAILLFIILFARLQLDNWMQTLFFTLGISFTFIFLYAVSQGLIMLVRRYFSSRWPYLWRQGLSNLYRPHNQTVVLIVSIGLGTALIATLFFVQDILLQRVQRASSEKQANMVLFDIQSAQKDAVKQRIIAEGLPVLEEVPIVTLQVAAVNGENLADVASDSTSRISSRVFRNEIRATYRDSLSDAEQITSGTWRGRVEPGDTAQVSLEKRYADQIGIQIGDRLLLNVQGVMIPAIVSSMREVDWNRFQTNFRMVLAKGSIDDAPQFHVLMTRVEGESESAAFQQLVVNQFPNVSVIDMNAVLQILDDLLGKIGFIIQFMGTFSILTGVVVLISAVMISKYQRIRENVLLRTLGASRKQIVIITVCEYLFLGIFSSVAGLLVALLASNLLAVFVFQSAFVPSMGFMLLLILFVSTLTVGIGTLNSLSILNRSPLEVLRKE
ncbi:FtsX-like permease family protein [Sphingobacterium olei]|uniref:FtsX-like permease family protein n=1 Tax=Sphingobacterium olei TaxID=2571155 RepID=A0A4U0ND64_9SPHI|nr:FtsX-like permease family protein [Sphingobacterium olei]TJZ51452.1 FtsX-like permease family protein [Sphingobacterium olei]